MLQRYKTKREEGFTIIEVLIVLAIAGLILLIVFLAIPALQRNNRNTSRNNDAARISALVTECLANRNGDIAACNDAGAIGFNAANFSIIEGVQVAAGFPADNETVHVEYNSVCINSGAAKDAGTSSRQFTVSYNTEGAGGSPTPRCTGSE